MVKKVGKYELGKTLGEGSFGKVKYAVNTETKEPVAMKILEKERILKQDMAEQIKREISIMKLIKQKHVVNLKDVLVSRTKIYLVLELVTGGELFYSLVKCGRFEENVARQYFQQLMDGVEYCHLQGIVHRDLKPENLLLDADGVLKISDFGLSALYQDNNSNQLLTTTCGTPNYVAPEVLTDSGYEGMAADIWSCGVILYVFLAGFLPFEEPTNEELFSRIVHTDFEYPPWFSGEAKDLLSRILVGNPKTRASIAQIKNHPWFREGYQEEIVQNLDVDIGDADFVGDDFVEAEEKIEKGNAPDGPIAITAFDLISMSGAFDLSRMLMKNPPENRIKRFTRFTSALGPNELLTELEGIMKDLDNMGIKIMPKKYKFHCTAATTKTGGYVTLVVQIFMMAPGLNMVDFRKGKGDLLEFHKLYHKIYQKCSHLLIESEVEEGVSFAKGDKDAPDEDEVLKQFGEGNTTRVSLFNIYPTNLEGEGDNWTQAMAIEHARFFFKHIWSEQDALDDCSEMYSLKYLMERLRIAYGLDHMNPSEEALDAVVDLIGNLPRTVKPVQPDDVSPPLSYSLEIAPLFSWFIVLFPFLFLAFVSFCDAQDPINQPFLSFARGVLDFSTFYLTSLSSMDILVFQAQVLTNTIFYPAVAIHIIEATYAFFVAKRIKSDSSWLWWFQTLLLGYPSLKLLLKRHDHWSSELERTIKFY